jgi:CRISPR system Cascade subunit CasA
MLEHSLLEESTFHITDANAAAACLSLPQVLARLSAGEDLDFTALRPHQRAPWHAFLVQLAYLALELEEETPPFPLSARAWLERLRALTSDHVDDAPWHLVNTDWQRPAFLQPPCSPGREADFKRDSDAAQDIDVLVTARHHDEKTGKLPLHIDAFDALVYALVLLQGWSAFLGTGNYNTMRMNGGFSSRPQFRLAFARGTGPEFVRDLTVLLQSRGELGERFRRLHPTADVSALHRLLWLPTWDDGSLPLSSVHPLCLEVCRRVRLVHDGGRYLMRRASSNAMRVAAREQRGNVMDPWVPIVLGDEPKALTAQAHSLGYRSLQAILFDAAKFDCPLLAQPSDAERRANQPGTWLAQVLVSGDGGTDGLLQRELPAPPAVLSLRSSAAATVARRAQDFVGLAGLASGKILRGALLQFVDGGDDVDWKNRDFTRAVEPWVDRYEQAIDEIFFEQLFDTLEREPDDEQAAQRGWVAWLATAAAGHLAVAVQALPTRDGFRRFARARAERLLRLSLRKQFGALLLPRPESEETLVEPKDGTMPEATIAHVQAPAKDPIASLAGQVRHASTRVLARLRRFHPDSHPQAALFETETMLVAAGVQPHDARQRQRWALVLHCLAVAQGRHDAHADADPGTVLARLRFSESRLRQLVEADDHVLATLMPRLARRLAAAEAGINWWPLADLLLHAGADSAVSQIRADAARQCLIRRYLDARSVVPGVDAGVAVAQA